VIGIRFGEVTQKYAAPEANLQNERTIHAEDRRPIRRPGERKAAEFGY
jgi:hypothetical protein